jgi:hypothetical protein
MKRLLALLCLLPILALAQVADPQGNTTVLEPCPDGKLYPAGGCPNLGEYAPGTVIDAAQGNVFFAASGAPSFGANGTFTNPWPLLGKVNEYPFPPGADVFLRATSVFENETLTVDWNGTESDRVTIGCYYNNGGVPTVCTSAQTRPEINGTWENCRSGTADCETVSTDPNAVPGGSVYNGLVTIPLGADYTTIQDLTIADSAGDGIVVQNLYSTPSETSTGIIIQRNEIRDTAFNAISSLRLYDSIIRGNDVSYTMSCEYQTRHNNPGQSDACDDSRDAWGAALSIRLSPNGHNLIEDNDVYQSYGELISVSLGSYNIVHKNRVGCGHSTAIYFQHSGASVAEKNIITGNRIGNDCWIPIANTAFGSVTAAMEVTNENLSQAGIPNIARNNLIANTQRGVRVGNLVTTRTDIDQALTSYGNTMATNWDIGLAFASSASASLFGNSDVRSNLIYKADSEDCQAKSTASLTFAYNVASEVSGTYDAECQTPGTGDVYGATYPLFGSDAEFKAMDVQPFPTADDFRLAIGSEAEGAGDPALETQVCLSADEFGDAVSRMNYGAGPDNGVAAWEKCLYDDFEGTPRSASAPNAGALEGTKSVPALTISSNGHYFEANGEPILLMADTAWHMAQDLSESEVDTYLQDRHDRGFNIVNGPRVFTRDGDFPYSGAQFANFYGEVPLTTTDPVVLNGAYWLHVDYMVDKALELGMYLYLPLIWGPDADGPFPQTAAGRALATSYATQVTSRYSSYNNIIWVVMGEFEKITWDTVADDDDVPLTASDEAHIQAYVNGIEAGKGANQLVSIHPDGWRSSSMIYHASSWLDFNSTQTAFSPAQSYTRANEDYNLSPAKPHYHAEGCYENAANDCDAGYVRLQQWLSFQGGARALAYGAGTVWNFNSGWETLLDQDGANDFARMRFFLESYDWWKLVPTQSMIVAGQGSLTTTQTTDYIAAQLSSDGDFGLVFSSQGDTFSLDLRGFSIPTIRARWWNPRDGVYTTIANYSNTLSSQSFDPPGSPAQDADWVLVLDAE